MKALLSVLLTLFLHQLAAQNLQLHYDPRHTIDPGRNPANYPTVYFEYFKAMDSGSHFIKPGNFLLKTEADAYGQQHNIGKFYLQVSQSFRFWKAPIFMSLQYSGGGGITDPKQYSYYINNSWYAGAEYPFRWKGAYLTAQIYDRYTPYSKPSNDVMTTLYWWKGFFHYKLELAGDFSTWTENKNHGDEPTSGLHGKRFFFFAEPQIWYNITKTIAAGSKVNMYYHVNTFEDHLEIYPTVAVRFKL